MALKQKLSLVLAAALALVLTVACAHQGVPAFLLNTPPIATTQQTTGPTQDDTPDAGKPGELPDDDAPAQVGNEPLKKPAWQKHFVVEINYKGPITAPGAKVIMATVARLNSTHHDPKQDPVEAVVFVVDTPGGDVSAGTTMVQQLQELEMPLVCVADDRAYSMGFFLLQAACPVRLMTDRGSLMVHEPHEGEDVTLVKPTRWDYWNQAEQLRVLTMGWLRVCAARMGIDTDSLAMHVRNTDWYMTAEDAESTHSVDAVVANIQRDVIKPLQERLELPRRLAVPAGLLRAPAQALPEEDLPPPPRHHRSHGSK